MRILSNNVVTWMMLLLHKEGGTPPVSKFRITEDSIQRITENGEKRITED